MPYSIVLLSTYITQTGMHILVSYVVTTARATANQTISVESMTDTVLVCIIPGFYQYPAWQGPPMDSDGFLTTYNNVQYPNFNPAIGQDRLSRLNWTDNHRDLKLSPVTRADEGDYACSYDGRTSRINLVVRSRQHFYLHTVKKKA